MKKPYILLVVGFLSHTWVGASLGESNRLAVHLRVHKSTLAVGEPLFITARVHNEGKVPAKVYWQNSSSYELRSKNPFLLVIAADGKKYHAWFDGFRPLGKTSPIELAPGAELITDLVILFSSRHGFAFEQPGEYWVSVKVIDTDMTSFQAEPIRVTVTKPGRENLAAWNLLGSKEFGKTYGKLVQVAGSAKLTSEDLEQCDHILETYPDSIYAEYLALSLGRWYQEGPKKDKSLSAQYFEIAKARASSKTVLDLASQVRVTMPLAKVPEQTPESPVEAEVRREVEAVFHGFIAAVAGGDIDRCLELTGEDFRGWSRAMQREELQEDIEKIKDLRHQGIPAEFSARVLSVVQSAEDVLITALVSYRQRTGPPADKTVRCRVRKYGDQWLLQDWTDHSQGR